MLVEKLTSLVTQYKKCILKLFLKKKRKSYQEQLRQKGGNLQNEAMCTFSSITLLSMGTNDLK